MLQRQSLFCLFKKQFKDNLFTTYICCVCSVFLYFCMWFLLLLYSNCVFNVALFPPSFSNFHFLPLVQPLSSCFSKHQLVVQSAAYLCEQHYYRNHYRDEDVALTWFRRRRRRRRWSWRPVNQPAALDVRPIIIIIPAPGCIVLLLFISPSASTNSSCARSGPAPSLDALISGAALGTARGKASPWLQYAIKEISCFPHAAKHSEGLAT